MRSLRFAPEALSYLGIYELEFAEASHTLPAAIQAPNYLGLYRRNLINRYRRTRSVDNEARNR